MLETEPQAMTHRLDDASPFSFRVLSLGTFFSVFVFLFG
jgi:hypothetical protein